MKLLCFSSFVRRIIKVVIFVYTTLFSHIFVDLKVLSKQKLNMYVLSVALENFKCLKELSFTIHIFLWFYINL